MHTEKFGSRAFRRGFTAGFSAPFRAVVGERLHISYTPRATDATAWREVGALLNQAYREVGEDIVKTSSQEADRKQPA